MMRRLLPFLLTQENTPRPSSSFAIFPEHHHRPRTKKKIGTRRRRTKKKRAWTRRRKMRRWEIGGRAGTRKMTGSLIRKMIDLAHLFLFLFVCCGGACIILRKKFFWETC